MRHLLLLTLVIVQLLGQIRCFEESDYNSDESRESTTTTQSPSWVKEAGFTRYELSKINKLRSQGHLPPGDTPVTKAMYQAALSYRGCGTEIAMATIQPNISQSNDSADDNIQTTAAIDDPNKKNRKRIFTWQLRHNMDDQYWPSKLYVENAYRKSFQTWVDACNIEFRQFRNFEWGLVDIEIKFDQVSQKDDVCEREYREEELAHITRNRVPIEIHFNGRTNWKLHEGFTTSKDIVPVAIHQIGHILGLSHSHDPSSVMYPGNENMTLSEADIRNAQKLYGAKTSMKPETTTQRYIPQAQCSENITVSRMPDGQGRLCAAVYKGEQCTGDILHIDMGNVTRRLNRDWIFNISSAQVNPDCKLTICKSDNLEGSCVNLFGRSAGVNHKHLNIHGGYNDVGASLSCNCEGQGEDTEAFVEEPEAPVTGQCPTTVTEFMPDRKRRMCAAIYSLPNCTGNRFPLDANNVTNNLNVSWINEVSSAEINPNCHLRICQFGTCKTLSGDDMGRNHPLLASDYNGRTVSISCSCDGIIPEDKQAVISQFVPHKISDFLPHPQFMPNTNNIRVCGMFMEFLLQPGSTVFWIKEQVAQRMPTSFNGSTVFNYIQGFSGCTLRYCSRTSLIECSTISGVQGRGHWSVVNDLPAAGSGIIVKSFVCDCR